MYRKRSPRKRVRTEGHPAKKAKPSASSMEQSGSSGASFNCLQPGKGFHSLQPKQKLCNDSEEPVVGELDVSAPGGWFQTFRNSSSGCSTSLG